MITCCQSSGTAVVHSLLDTVCLLPVTVVFCAGTIPSANLQACAALCKAVCLRGCSGRARLRGRCCQWCCSSCSHEADDGSAVVGLQGHQQQPGLHVSNTCRADCCNGEQSAAHIRRARPHVPTHCCVWSVAAAWWTLHSSRCSVTSACPAACAWIQRLIVTHTQRTNTGVLSATTPILLISADHKTVLVFCPGHPQRPARHHPSQAWLPVGRPAAGPRHHRLAAGPHPCLCNTRSSLHPTGKGAPAACGGFLLSGWGHLPQASHSANCRGARERACSASACGIRGPDAAAGAAVGDTSSAGAAAGAGRRRRPTHGCPWGADRSLCRCVCWPG